VSYHNAAWWSIKNCLHHWVYDYAVTEQSRLHRPLLRHSDPGGSGTGRRKSWAIHEFYREDDDDIEVSVKTTMHTIGRKDLWLPTALAGRVKQSEVSVCPSVCFYCFNKPTASSLKFWTWVCVWVITIARLGLKVKVKGQESKCSAYWRGNTVTRSDWLRSSIEDSFSSLECIKKLFLWSAAQFLCDNWAFLLFSSNLQ